MITARHITADDIKFRIHSNPTIGDNYEIIITHLLTGAIRNAFPDIQAEKTELEIHMPPDQAPENLWDYPPVAAERRRIIDGYQRWLDNMTKMLNDSNMFVEPVPAPASVIVMDALPGIVYRLTMADFANRGYHKPLTPHDLEQVSYTVRSALFDCGVLEDAIDSALLQWGYIDAMMPRLGAMVVAAEDIDLTDKGLLMENPSHGIIPMGYVAEIVRVDTGGRIYAAFEDMDLTEPVPLNKGQYNILRCDNNFTVGCVVVFVDDTRVFRDFPTKKRKLGDISQLDIKRGQIGIVKHWRNESNIGIAIKGQPPANVYSCDPHTMCVVTGDITGFSQWYNAPPE